MKALKVSLCAAVAVAAMGAASAAFADDAPTGLQVTWNVGGATDYIFRGIDQTGPGDSGEVFGGADLTYGKFYAGTWLSNTGPRADNGLEYDLYGGWKPSLGPATLDLGFYYYGYNSSRLGNVSSNFDTLEWKAGVSVPAGPFTIGAVAYYSDDYASSSKSSWYEEGDISYTFKNKATLSAAIGGFQSDSLAKNYMTWNAGVTYPVTDKLSLDVRYIGTNAAAKTSYGAGFGFDGAIATLKLSF